MAPVYLVLPGRLDTLTGGYGYDRRMVAGLREELAGFQDQIDSLHVELAHQDSLIRVLANLQGMPLPPKSPGIIPPD